MAPTFGSLFAGIGGFDLGLERAGWRCAFQVEIDPFCQRVLAKHWPHVERFADVRTIGVSVAYRDGHGQGASAVADLGRYADGGIDLLCGGFPCQDLSVAGKRAGLGGERSGLFWEFLRVARLLSPRWLLLENVPGLLSSRGGRDFGTLLAGLEDSGYQWAYRILDSQHFGVAQRRRRVFIVGHRGSPVPPAVLFEPARRVWHPAPGREAGARVAASLSQSTHRVGFGGGDDNDAGEDGTGRGVPMVTFALGSHAGSNGDVSNRAHASGGPVGSNISEELAYALREGRGQAIARQMVRRLTPTECERLQGFPDGWTCLCGVEPYSTMTCRCPDSPRYRALGNGVTTTVAEWIGRRLMTHLEAPTR